MKKIKIYFLLLLLISSARVKGDFIMDNPVQPAVIYAGFQNLIDFPEISVIGLPDGVVYPKSNKAFEVKAGSYFIIQKFFPVTIYAVKRKYLEKIGILKIDWKSDKNVLKSNLVIDAKAFHEKTPIKMVQLEYKIAGLTDSTITIYKSDQKNVSK